jgi:methylated-DNA-[protein]-cysteine S-methyltransferase
MSIPTDLDRRFRDAAARSGMLDAGYDLVETPLGELLVAATDRGLLRISFDPDPDAELERIERLAGRRVLRSAASVDKVHRELDEYFAGRRHAFDVALDHTLSAGFRAKALQAVAAIPFGRTGTYASIAAAAGSPRAVRAAGTACATNPIPLLVPCHRVVRSDGSMGRYGGGEAAKRLLLDLEHAVS